MKDTHIRVFLYWHKFRVVGNSIHQHTFPTCFNFQSYRRGNEGTKVLMVGTVAHIPRDIPPHPPVKSVDMWQNSGGHIIQLYSRPQEFLHTLQVQYLLAKRSIVENDLNT